MTFGVGGGSPKSLETLVATGPYAPSFDDVVFETCAENEITIIYPILVSYGTGGSGGDVYNFGGFKIREIDPITGGMIGFGTNYGASPNLPYVASPNYGRSPVTPTASDIALQRYATGVSQGGGNLYGGGIILWPGESISWQMSNSNPVNTYWKLRYGKAVYTIAS